MSDLWNRIAARHDDEDEAAGIGLVYLLEDPTQRELASERPRRAADGRGFVTSRRIAQEVRVASAQTSDGVVSVIEDNGIWRLSRVGERALRAFAYVA